MNLTQEQLEGIAARVFADRRKVGGDPDAGFDCVKFDAANEPWSLFGAMVERARECGWDMEIQGNSLFFNTNISDPNAKTTKCFRVNDSHVKACALAFLDIPVEEFEVKK